MRNWAQILVLKMFVPLDVLRGFAYVYSESLPASMLMVNASYNFAESNYIFQNNGLKMHVRFLLRNY